MNCKVCKQRITRRRGAGVFYRFSYVQGSFFNFDYVIPMHESCTTDAYTRRRYVDMKDTDRLLDGYVKGAVRTQTVAVMCAVFVLLFFDQKYVLFSLSLLFIVDVLLSLEDVVNITVLKRLRALPL